MFQEYAIDNIYHFAVFGHLLKKIADKKNDGLKKVVSELESIVRDLRSRLMEANSTINKNNEVI